MRRREHSSILFPSSISALLFLCIISLSIISKCIAYDGETYSVDETSFNTSLGIQTYASSIERAMLTMLNWMRIDPIDFREHWGMSSNVLVNYTRTQNPEPPPGPLLWDLALSRDSRLHAWDLSGHNPPGCTFGTTCFISTDDSPDDPLGTACGGEDFVCRQQHFFGTQPGINVFREVLARPTAESPRGGFDALVGAVCSYAQNERSVFDYSVCPDDTTQVKFDTDGYHWTREAFMYFEFKHVGLGHFHNITASEFGDYFVLDFNNDDVNDTMQDRVIVAGSHGILHSNKNNSIITFYVVISGRTWDVSSEEMFLVLNGTLRKMNRVSADSVAYRLDVPHFWGSSCLSYVFMFFVHGTGFSMERVERYPESGGVYRTYLADVDPSFCSENYVANSTSCSSDNCFGNGTCYENGECICRDGWYSSEECAWGCGDGEVNSNEGCDIYDPNNPTFPASCCEDNCSAYKPSGTFCHVSSGGLCEMNVACDGSHSECIYLLNSTWTCWEAVGDCDRTAHCDGISLDCDRFQGRGTVCRSSINKYDPEERCTGDSVWCPKNVYDSPSFLDIYPLWLLIPSFLLLVCCCCGFCHCLWCSNICRRRNPKLINQKHWDKHGQPAKYAPDRDDEGLFDVAPETKEEAQEEARLAWLKDQERRKEEVRKKKEQDVREFERSYELEDAMKDQGLLNAEEGQDGGEGNIFSVTDGENVPEQGEGDLGAAAEGVPEVSSPPIAAATPGEVEAPSASAPEMDAMIQAQFAELEGLINDDGGMIGGVGGGGMMNSELPDDYDPFGYLG